MDFIKVTIDRMYAGWEENPTALINQEVYLPVSKISCVEDDRCMEMTMIKFDPGCCDDQINNSCFLVIREDKDYILDSANWVSISGIFEVPSQSVDGRIHGNSTFLLNPEKILYIAKTPFAFDSHIVPIGHDMQDVWEECNADGSFIAFDKGCCEICIVHSDLEPDDIATGNPDCEYRYETFVFDNVTLTAGTPFDLTAIETQVNANGGIVENFETDLVSVAQNGMSLSKGNPPGNRDYDVSGTDLTFTFDLDDCRLIIGVSVCYP